MQDLEYQLELLSANIKPKGLSIFFAHGYIYFFCWNIFALVQIATARYMRDKWQTNMLLHTAFGTLISFATMYWGFWAIKIKSGFDLSTYNQLNITFNATSNTTNVTIKNPTGQGGHLHTFSAMTVPLMSVPLLITGFIAYFRRW